MREPWTEDAGTLSGQSNKGSNVGPTAVKNTSMSASSSLAQLN